MPAVDSSYSLADRYTRAEGRIYLSGLQALVRLPIDQQRYDHSEGRRTAAFISGYEGSPLAGYDIELGRQSALLAEHDVIVSPALNEELAVNAVQGTQLACTRPDRLYDGVTGFWYGKAPGLDRATDALRHANLGGASPRGGAVVIVGDDAQAKSSTYPSGSEPALADLGIPTLSPEDPQAILDLGRHAVSLSRFCGLWVALKVATSVADGSATAAVSRNRIHITRPDNTVDGRSYEHEVTSRFMHPTLGDLERSLHGPRLDLARRYAAANRLNVVSGGRDARLGVVSAGATYLALCQALESLGLAGADDAGPVRILKLGMVFPLEPAVLDEFAAGLDEIMVVEEKQGFVESALKAHFYGRPNAPRVIGKRDEDGRPLLRSDGDLDAQTIRVALAPRLPRRSNQLDTKVFERRSIVRSGTVLPLLTRTPFFCSGCPHNRSTQTPEGSLVGAGIGCGGMAMLLPQERVGEVLGFTQMGGEGATWIGMQPFLKTPHMVQNMGDGTFHHSGSLAVRAAVAAGSRITFKILYNSAVAMTGGQQVLGAMTVAAMAQMLLAEGVKRVVVTTDDPRRYRRARLPRGVQVRDRDDLVAIQRDLAGIDGVTVLIHDQECAAELRRSRKRGLADEPDHRAFINERLCEGCGDCGEKSNCLSVQPVDTKYGRKTQIHQPSCNKDFSCLDGDCPSFLTVVPAPRTTVRKVTVDDVDDDFPAPEPAANPDHFAMRITGIGGTGVITLAQVLATAGVLAGREVRALDQTGLAQKGGAVVSDVKLSTAEHAASNKIDDGACDLYLACDVLVASTAENLRVCDPDHTIGIVSTSEVPTGHMVIDPSVRFPLGADILERFTDAIAIQRSQFLDARALTRRLFGDDQFANLFLVGVAHQCGIIPLDGEHIEAAIALNGVAVAKNVQAFRRGRQFIADPDAFAAAGNPSPVRSPKPAQLLAAGGLAERMHTSTDSALVDVVTDRWADLVAYQNRSYADEYIAFVAQVRDAEVAIDPTRSELSEAVARNLYKLMAYKDEYEVARLCLDPAMHRAVRDEFGDESRIGYRLHPPVLRALGMNRKITLGAWFRVVFAALYAMRFLRGSLLNPFGWGTVRRTERRLPVEYRHAVATLLARATAANLAELAATASLPDMVRGYEQIKMGNVERYRAELAQRLTDAGGAGAATPALP